MILQQYDRKIVACVCVYTCVPAGVQLQVVCGTECVHVYVCGGEGAVCMLSAIPRKVHSPCTDKYNSCYAHSHSRHKEGSTHMHKIQSTAYTLGTSPLRYTVLVCSVTWNIQSSVCLKTCETRDEKKGSREVARVYVKISIQQRSIDYGVWVGINWKRNSLNYSSKLCT